MTVSARKASIRQEILARRVVFSGTTAGRAASQLAQAVLLAAFPPGRGGTVGLYVPLPGEVDTEAVRLAWEEGGGIACYPAVLGGGGMRYYPRPEDGRWLRGPHGVPEPPSVPGGEVTRFDLLVVPGVAFDRRGTRLGRGAGCYDRFLPTIPPPAALAGLAWSWQVVDELPADRWDVPVGAVVTEEGLVLPGVLPAGPSPIPHSGT